MVHGLPGRDGLFCIALRTFLRWQVAELARRLDEAQLPPDARTAADRELRRLKQLQPAQAEQHVAACGSVRRRVAACGSMWQRVAAGGSMWKHVAAHGSMWQHVEAG